MKSWKILAIVFIVYSVLATISGGIMMVKYIKNNKTMKEFKGECDLYKDLFENKLIYMTVRDFEIPVE